jgi:hypothetical protein
MLRAILFALAARTYVSDLRQAGKRTPPKAVPSRCNPRK